MRPRDMNKADKLSLEAFDPQQSQNSVSYKADSKALKENKEFFI